VKKLPASAALHEELGGEAHWSVLSRGDRVRGRTWKPAGRGRAPVAILCSPDGPWQAELLLRARSAWPALALATFDLVLCGARRSDKLSAQALDPRQPLALRLRDELEAQTAADLAAVCALLRADRSLDPARVSLVAVGLAAELARAFAEGEHGLHALALEKSAAPSDAWLRELAPRLAR
jgi:hypothetical protein